MFCEPNVSDEMGITFGIGRKGPKLASVFMLCDRFCCFSQIADEGPILFLMQPFLGISDHVCSF